MSLILPSHLYRLSALSRTWHTHRVTAMASVPKPSDQDLFNELSLYTLELRDSAFIHQHIVDAFAVQHADANTRPIAIVFGLIGLASLALKKLGGAP